MPKIELLSDNVINMIAAGEVVERPASVVKELIENSVDAQSSHITVEIKNGGVSYIRITDDGRGIEASEVALAFTRHATSKLRTAEDLQSLTTMGFRGEALAAVSSVSRVDMFTRRKSDKMGRHICVEGGKITSEDETGCQAGTNIVIRDLFFNTQPRLKFLKKETTEAAVCADAVITAAIAHPDISFNFIKDGKDEFFTTGNGKVRDVLYAAFDRETVKQLLHFEGERFGMKLKGFIAPPSVTRSNRNMQMFFVNGRPVKSSTLSAAADNAYKGTIVGGGKYPVYFIMLEMSPSLYDINVHPAKKEIKFDRERDVFVGIFETVKAALDNQKAEKEPEISLKSAKIEYKPVILSQNNTAETETEKAVFADVKTDLIKQIREPSQQVMPEYSKRPAFTYKPYEKTEEKREKAPQYLKPEIKDDAFKIVGEAFKTYIIAEYDSSLWLIDKHAVHEKLIYNKLKEQAEEPMIQQLLTPVSVSLSRTDRAALSENAEAVASVGFDISDMGELGISVRAIPSYIDIKDIAETVSEIAQKLSENRKAETDKLDALYKSVACRGAIKAGNDNDLREFPTLVSGALFDKSLANCPHGRPTAVKITRQELEKMFKRIV